MKNGKYATIFHSPMWGHKQFISLWLARTISLIGDQIYLLALPWLTYNLTHSGTKMSFVIAFEMLPFIIFSLVGGVLSDKLNKRYCLIYGNILALLPLLAVYLLYQTGNLEMWHVYTASFVLSSIVAIVLPAFEACIPNMLSKEELVSANSLTESTSSLISILGPLLAGGLIAWIGADVAIIVNGASFLLAGLIFVYTRFDQPATNGVTLKQVLRSFAEGLQYVPRHKLLRWGVFMSTCNNLVLGAYSAILIYYMRDDLGFDSGLTGSVMATASVASIIVSSFLAPTLSRRFRKGFLMVLCLGLFGLGVVIVGLSNGIAMLIVGQAVYMGAITLFQINWYSLRQTVVPKDMIGRVSGVCRGIAYFGASIGAFTGGMLLTKFTPSELFLIDGCAVFVISLLAMMGRLFRTDTVVEVEKSGVGA